MNQRSDAFMYFEIFGIPFDFSPKNVLLASFITSIIYLIFHIFISLRRFSPFKKDKLANESLYFIYMIRYDYFNNYAGFLIQEREVFMEKLSQVADIYDVQRMQEKSYRIQFQSLLRKHHELLKEAYFLFEGLNHVPVLERKDVIEVVNRTHEILNQIIEDINEEFKDISRPVA